MKSLVASFSFLLLGAVGARRLTEQVMRIALDLMQLVKLSFFTAHVFLQIGASSSVASEAYVASDVASRDGGIS